MAKKEIIVVSGPSGVGKTLFIEKTLELYPQFQNTVTYTTRPPRKGETAPQKEPGGGGAALPQNKPAEKPLNTEREGGPAEGEAPRGGKFYHFVSSEEFDELEKQGRLAERAWVHGHRYGTAFHELERLWGAGKSIIKDLDIQGARSIKKAFPQAVTVFIYPPSMDELKSRLIKRGTEGEKALRQRLSAAEREMAEGRRFDFKIINDVFEEAWSEFQRILPPRAPADADADQKKV